MSFDYLSFGSVLSFIVPLLALTAVYIFFVVASIAVARSRLGRLNELQDQEVRGAQTAAGIVERHDTYLTCAQICRFLATLGIGVHVSTFLRCTSGVIGSESQTSPLLGVIVATALIAGYVVGILVVVHVGKTIALQFPERTLCFLATPLRGVCALFRPFVSCINSVVTRVLARYELRKISERDISLSTDDLSEIVKLSSETGAIEKSEQELIEGIVELSDRIVKEIMTPRTDIVWVRDSISTQDLVKVFQREAVSRVLVCGADLDEVRGLVLAKDMLRYVGQSVLPSTWKPLVRPVYFVPITKPVDKLLGELRQMSVHLAVVLNEHGGVEGLITLEDLIEEIVGDISDEFDVPENEALLRSNSDGGMVVDGGMQISRLENALGIEFPEGQYDTLAGFVLAHLGRVPDEGDSFLADNLSCTVLKVDKQRVVQIALKVLPPTTEGANEEVESLSVNGANSTP
jgi:putative hemolysin